MNPFPQKLEIIRMKQKLNGGVQEEGAGAREVHAKKSIQRISPTPPYIKKNTCMYG